MGVAFFQKGDVFRSFLKKASPKMFLRLQGVAQAGCSDSLLNIPGLWGFIDANDPMPPLREHDGMQPCGAWLAPRPTMLFPVRVQYPIVRSTRPMGASLFR